MANPFFGADPEDRIVQIKNRKYRLELTCVICPEQWDVYCDLLVQAGYIRLRHGEFRVDYPDCGGKTLMEISTGMDGDGCFNDEVTRNKYLLKAVKAIDEEILDSNPSLWRILKKKVVSLFKGSVSRTSEVGFTPLAFGE